MSSYRITDPAVEERPRDRLERLGPQALTTAERLAILVRVGIAGENPVQVEHWLLRRFSGLSGLQRAAFEEFCAERGLGPARAA